MELGIDIQQELTYTATDTPSMVKYWLFNSKQENSNLFVSLEATLSSDEKRLFIKNGKNKSFKGNLGYVFLHRNDGRSGWWPQVGDLYSIEFFPFGQNPDGNVPFLLGKGIADLIECAISEDLLKTFDPLNRIMHRGVTDYRSVQLHRLGLRENVWYTLEEHNNILSRAREKQLNL